MTGSAMTAAAPSGLLGVATGSGAGEASDGCGAATVGVSTPDSTPGSAEAATGYTLRGVVTAKKDMEP